MVNSRSKPSAEEEADLIKRYGEKFGDDFADAIAATFKEPGVWGKNPAKKQTAKIMMNSVWGKHAERINQVKTEVFDKNTDKEDVESIYSFYQNVFDKNYEFMSMVYMGNDRSLVRYRENAGRVTQDLHKAYIPAACFVPAYGRLQLEEQLYKLGKRVLMNDTDSIVYHYIPGEYNIPEGDLLGDWEVEDVDKQNDGLAEFVGIGPKTYAFRTFKNDVTVVKAKGISIKHAHGKIINFDTMKQLVVDQIRDPQQQPKKKIKVPQMTMRYSANSEVNTYKFIKDLKLDVANLKGRLVGPYLYPFGYEDGEEEKDLSEDLTQVY